MIIRQLIFVAGILAATGVLSADESQAKPGSLEAVRAKIRELQVPDVAWRKIPWRSCLLDGLRESQRAKKPLMLWIFIDRPVDDARC